MKPVYSNINLANGPHVSGICKIQVAPLHTLNSRINRSFIAGVVNENLDFSAPMIEIPFAPGSAKISQKPKSSKSGDYFEINIEGLLNELSAEQFRKLETLRFEKLITLVSLVDGSQLIIGSNVDGMRLNFSSELNTTQQQIAYELNFVSEYTAPHYVP